LSGSGILAFALFNKAGFPEPPEVEEGAACGGAVDGVGVFVRAGVATGFAFHFCLSSSSSEA